MRALQARARTERRSTSLAIGLLLAACSGAQPRAQALPRPTPPTRPTRSPPDPACEESRRARAQIPDLLRTGHLQRTARILRDVESRCPDLAPESWAVELDTLGELGEVDELTALIDRVLSSDRATPDAVRAARRWRTAQSDPPDPFALIEAGRSARAQGQVDFQRHFDRALVALESSTGQRARPYAPNGFWGGVTALEWQGDRLFVAASPVRVLDGQSFEPVYEISLPIRPTYLSATPDGRHLLAGATDDTLLVWDLAHRSELVASAYRENAYGARVRSDAVESLVTHRRGLAWHRVTTDDTVDPPEREFTALAVSHGGRLAAIRQGTDIALVPITDRPVTAKAEPTDPKQPPPGLQPLAVLHSPEGANGAGDAAVFSPDDRRLAAIAGDFDVVVFDVIGRRKIAQFEHDATVTTLRFSPDGRRLASSGYDCSARVWDLATRREVHRAEHAKEVTAIAFSPDGRRLATGSPDGVLEVTDIETHQQLYVAAPHVPRVEAMRFADSGELVAAMSDGTVRLWGSGGRHTSLPSHQGTFHSLWTDAKAEVVAAATGANALRVWSRVDASVLRSSEERTRFMMPSTISDDGRLVFFGLDDGSVVVEELRTGTRVWSAQVKPGPELRSLALSHDGKTLAVGCRDNTLLLLDAASGGVRREIEGHLWMVDQIFFTRDDRRIVSRGGDVHVWDAGSGKSLVEFRPVPGTADAIALAPDDAAVLVATNSGEAFTLALDDGRRLRSFDLGEIHPTSLAFSPDGRFVAAASWQRELGLWSAETGERVLTICAVEGMEGGYLLAPDGGIEVVGQEPQRAERYLRCRVGDVTLDFSVCQDALGRAGLFPALQ